LLIDERPEEVTDMQRSVKGEVVSSADADGKLDASYANPNPLPFHAATATEDGGTLKLFFELRAGGYNGSTYTLNYDAAGDRLKGTYYQAVAKQTFEVVFIRK
jgi:hypothetical protein